jgi:hypothetical protein
LTDTFVDLIKPEIDSGKQIRYQCNKKSDRRFNESVEVEKKVKMRKRWRRMRREIVIEHQDCESQGLERRDRRGGPVRGRQQLNRCSISSLFALHG